MKTWDLAKKSDFTPFLSSGTENENFLHTMIIYIENETHGEILRKNVDSLFKLTQSTTVKLSLNFLFLKSGSNYNYIKSIALQKYDIAF